MRIPSPRQAMVLLGLCLHCVMFGKGSEIQAQTQPPPIVVYFGNASDSYSENAGTVQSQVYLSAPSTSVVTVNYQTNPNDPPPSGSSGMLPAQPGVDYQPVSGQLTFNPGETVQSVPLTLLNGDNSASPLYVGIDLSDPVGAVLSDNPAYPTTHYVIIYDTSSPDGTSIIAVDDDADVDDDTMITASGNVLSNDDDPDGDALTVVAVNGSAANVGTAVQGTYGTLVTNSDGTYTYTVNTDSLAVIDLPEDQVVVDQFTYTCGDRFGGTALANQNIRVNPKRKRCTITYPGGPVLRPRVFTQGSGTRIRVTVSTRSGAGLRIKLKLNDITGADISYYAAAAGGKLLPGTTPVVTGADGTATFYVDVDSLPVGGPYHIRGGQFLPSGNLDPRTPPLPAYQDDLTIRIRPAP